jgi:hypothetical protein
MYTCPKCDRKFKVNNQSHMCTTNTIDDLFVGKPDNVVLAFESVLNITLDWEPQSIGASVNTIIFTNKKAWLIVRPMSKELDVKFYYSEPLDNGMIFKVVPYGRQFGHHIRLKNGEQVTNEIIDLLRKGFDHGLKG